MNFNKCNRCGSFYLSDSNLCPNCERKEKNEISKLKSYLLENKDPLNIEDISYYTGISNNKITNYLDQEDFKEICKNIEFEASPKTNKTLFEK